MDIVHRQAPPHSDLDLFQYTPFEETSGWIRLLEFLPGDAIRCKLRHYKLDDLPNYVALSYAWGDVAQPFTIYVEDAKLRITENLFTAILHLRNRLRKGNLLFWADGICINQADVKERGEQVAQMKSIYRRASHVYGWLGRAQDDSQDVIDQMARWQKAQSKNEHMLDEYLATIEATDPFYFGPSDSNGSHKFWPSILILWECTWWNRAWVLQETVLARDLRLFYGHHEIELGSIIATINLQQELVQIHEIAELGVGPSPSNLTDARYLYRIDHQERGIPFLNVLETLRLMGCTDPRDRVYSGIGLASDIKEGDIRPDYSKSVAAVYTQATEVIFHSALAGNELEFLGYIHDHPSHSHYPRLPSWVPDWCLHTVCYPFLKYIDIESDKKVYDASSGSLLHARIDGNAFQIQGFEVDTIVQRTPTSNISRHEDLSIERSWEPDNLKDNYPSGGDVENAWLRCLVADVRRDWVSVTARGNIMCWSKMTKRALWGEEMLFSSMKSATLGRRMFYTKKGYIGLGPNALEIGDKIVVFFGGQMLYIVGKNEDGSYRFVGESYVQGLMDGEAMDESLFNRTVQDFMIV